MHLGLKNRVAELEAENKQLRKEKEELFERLASIPGNHISEVERIKLAKRDKNAARQETDI